MTVEGLGFLCFFVGGVLFTPLAILFERELAFHFANIFSRPVIVVFTRSALKADKIWLGHAK